VGGSGARWVPVRSRRESRRTWASLTAVGRFAEGVGLSGFSVELQPVTASRPYLQTCVLSSSRHIASLQD